jgi:hypothetical protein
MDDDDEILATDRADFGVEIADHCQWPGCGETEHLKLSATAEEFFALCPRHLQAVLHGEFEFGGSVPVAGEA